MQRIFILGLFTVIAGSLFISAKNLNNKQGYGIKVGEIYVCLPCGSDCDAVEYKTRGTCSQCNMDLVEKSTIKHTNVKPEDLCSFISNAGSGNVLILDVRTTAEFEGKTEEKLGRLKSAINIPIQQLEARLNELEPFKDKKIVVYCSRSHRSPRASYMLNQKGFKNVINMQGGMSVWAESVKDKECNEKLFVRH